MKSQFVGLLQTLLVIALPSAGSRSVSFLMLGSTCIVLGYTCCVDLKCLVVVCSPCLSCVLLLARAKRLQVLVSDELTSGSGEALHIDVVALVLVGQEGGQILHLFRARYYLQRVQLLEELAFLDHSNFSSPIVPVLNNVVEKGNEHN